MTAIPALDESEKYLAALLDDPSGIELAEFMFVDEEKPDRCFRLWDFQWPLLSRDDTYQIDQMGRALGKALDTETPIPTPRGWTTMGQLRAGDIVYGSDGSQIRVLAARPVQHDRPCYEVVFDDGQTIVADADHLWFTTTKADVKRNVRPGRVRTTRQIASSLLVGGEYNHRVAVCGDLQGGGALPIPPYVLGVWLGDGSRASNMVTLNDHDRPEIEVQIKAAGYQLSAGSQQQGCRSMGMTPVNVPHYHRDSFGSLLRAQGLGPAKFIPHPYLRAGADDRRALLAGLMDTDGHITKESYAEYTTVDHALALDIGELLTSLGQKPRITQRRAVLNGRDCGPCWRLTWRPTFSPSRLARKDARFVEPSQPSRMLQRRIVDARPVPSRPVRCITVDAPDRLYLAGEGMIPTHNSMGIVMRAFAFPFNYPGAEMLITAPELNHLRPVTDKVETLLLETRLAREMLPNVKGGGINHQPQFQVRFINGARIISRLPNRDGRGTKGMHPLIIELDEGQNYPEAGWVEIIETMKAGSAGAQWRVHGVSRGVRDTYYRLTMGENPALPFFVHRYIGPHRPSWSREERLNKIAIYGGTEDNVDYRRNVFGEHGDAHNPIFVLARLMACVRINESAWATEYNTDIYTKIKVNDELFRKTGMPIENFLTLPQSHLIKGYSSYWGGMDVGFTNDPTEILIFGVVGRAGKPDLHRLLTRVQLKRIDATTQAAAVAGIFDFYGTRLRRMGLDKMQPVSEPVLTPQGWVPIGTIRVGDEVIGSDGRPTRVSGVYPQVDRRVMRVTCSDGSWARCGPEHLWTVEDRKMQRLMTVTTEQLAYFRKHSAQRRWTIPVISAPIDGPPVVLPLDPYVMGALLGDGNFRDKSVRFSSGDPYVVDKVNRRLPKGFHLHFAGKYDYEISSVNGRRKQGLDGRFVMSNPVVAAIARFGMNGKKSPDKWVPEEYMRGNATQRLDLLQGLMDTDGHVTVMPSGHSCNVGMNTTSGKLAEAIVALVESFGGSARCTVYPPRAEKWAAVYRLSIKLPYDVNPFSLPRKRDQVIDKEEIFRYVDTVAPDGEEASVCLRVEAEDHLYVTRHHLLTHNTGNGLPLWQLMREHPSILNRIAGYGFSEKKPVEFDDRPLVGRERPQDAVIEKNVIDFACVDDQTEILTRRGWKRHEQVIDGEDVLTWDTERNMSCWAAVETILRYYGDIPVRRIEHRAFSAVTTLDHRWWVQRGGGDWVWRTTKTLGRFDRVPKPQLVANLPLQAKYSDALVEMLGWLWAEGSVMWWGRAANGLRSHAIERAPQSLRVSQSERVNPASVQRIEQLFMQLGISAPSSLHDNDVREWRIGKEDSALFFQYLDRNTLAWRPEFVAMLTQAQLDLLIDTALAGDGWQRGNAWAVGQVADERGQARVDSFQMACSLAGRPTTATVMSAGPLSVKEKIHVTVSARSMVAPVCPIRMGSMAAVMVDETAPMVWCPRTASGTWLARRRGTVYFTGNTDALRGYVDTGALELPYDVELLSEFQGQSMRTIQDVGSNAGISRRYSGGQCHTLDGARMFAAAKELESIEAILAAPARHGPVLDQFG